MARGYENNSSDSLEASRFRPGHPEGYALAFANLYTDFVSAIMYRNLNRDPSVFLNRITGIDDGLRVMALIEAALKSYENDGKWTDVYR